jgi:integrase
VLNNISNAPPRSTAEQRDALARNTGRFGDRPPSTKFFDAARCEGPGCQNIIPAGTYPAQRKRSFCSDMCRNRFTAKEFVVGTCKCGCGKPVLGRKDQVGKKQFVDDEHYGRFVRERQLGDTNCFRPLFERYIAGDAKTNYKAGTLPAVKSGLAKVLRFAAMEGISDINEIRSDTITKFIAAEMDRGTMHRTYVGYCSTFFNCLIEDGLYTHPNPVIPRRHYVKVGEAAPRPYNDAELAEIWALVEATGKYELMLAFAFGEECGLRVGEVANIRLPDADRRAQNVFVRLPTKNNRTRSVPYHDKVKKYLALWLEHRSQHCPTDHVLHNNADHPFNQSQLDNWFKQRLRDKGEPASSFNFHRLRHTWATRLMNNGMELAVLKELGGWRNWNSMQRYIKVLPATVRRQYEAAYKKLQDKQNAGEDECLSLLEFAAIAGETSVTTEKKAA